MAKHVLDNHGVAHAWATGKLQHARTPNGNMYFEGGEIYSYGTHYCIASIIERDDLDRAKVVLFNRASSTATTEGKHKSAVRNAIPHFAKTFLVDVPHVGSESWSGRSDAMARNCAGFRVAIDDLIAKAKKAKGLRAYFMRKAEEEQRAAVAFCKYFKIKGEKFPLVWDSKTSWKRAVEEALELERRKNESVEKAALTRRANRPLWVQGITVGGAAPDYEIAAWRARERRSISHNDVLLRLDTTGKFVQTSKGAEVLIDDAVKLIRYYDSCIARNVNYKRMESRGGHMINMQLGPYTLDSIDVDNKQITVGCHLIKEPEIEYMREQLAALLTD